MSDTTDIAGAKPKPKKKRLTAKQKLNKRLKIGGGALVFILLCVWALTQPLTGTIQVPICRTYAELQLLYPETMQITQVDYPTRGTISGADRVLRLYYTFIGAFGEPHSAIIDCKFATDPVTHQVYLEEIDMDRNPVDQDKVDAYNKTIPAVIASNPSRLIPKPLPDDLLHIKPPDDTE